MNLFHQLITGSSEGVWTEIISVQTLSEDPMDEMAK